MIDEEFEQEYAEAVEPIRKLAEDMLLEFWGRRCPDYEETCIICRKWKALDELLSGP